MDPFLSGRGAEPVFRDKEGKRISKEEMLKTQEEKKPKEKKLEWGKGLAQKREAEANAKELELEREKPFARTRYVHLAHTRLSLVTYLILEDLGDNEKMKESGFIIPQTIPSHSWLKRGIDFPPNRYGMKPGRHWDGVDRSNANQVYIVLILWVIEGFEKESIKRQNEKRATEREAYLWSVSDM
ncbi:hypothetical protein GW17_00053685 [Ensete ventricosum]|nr:hypothetical protein GW17_00053685 [Ensete ventricosum]RZR82483.1 hypothetical protein BHM03_00008925 [Ensete ventricosum]